MSDEPMTSIDQKTPEACSWHDEPDRDALVEILARAIHGDIVGIDFDSLDDGERADFIDIAIDVLDALDGAGLIVLKARLPAARCD